MAGESLTGFPAHLCGLKLAFKLEKWLYTYMAQTYPHPFACNECATQPPSAFEMFTPAPHIDDWIIVYPQKHLIHVHFGTSVQEEKINTAEAQFIYSLFMRWAAQYPGKKFFVVVDGTRGDDSEFVTDEARKLYMNILRHPQFQHGVFYGFTQGMIFYINMLLFVTRRKIRLVGSRTEADEEYKKWWAQQVTS